jgi:hypothetical protein
MSLGSFQALKKRAPRTNVGTKAFDSSSSLVEIFNRISSAYEELSVIADLAEQDGDDTSAIMQVERIIGDALRQARPFVVDAMR